MNKELYRWIRDLICQNPAETTIRSDSIIGRKVLEKYRCGHSRNGKLVFTALDKAALRRLVKDELELDPFVDDLPDNRIDMARGHDNEKLARKPASHDHVLLNCPVGRLQLNGRHIDLQAPFIASAGLTALALGITEIGHASLVVVENLEIMRTAPNLSCLPHCMRRYGFTGAIRQPAPESMLVMFKEQIASRSGFDVQGETLAYLLSTDKTGLSAELAALIAALCDERSSFRQEHMLAHAVLLALYSLR